MTSPATASQECKKSIGAGLYSCPRDRRSVTPSYRLVGSGKCQTALGAVPAHTEMASWNAAFAPTEARCKEACSGDDHCAAYTFTYKETAQKTPTCMLFSRTDYQGAYEGTQGPFTGWTTKQSLGSNSSSSVFQQITGAAHPKKDGGPGCAPHRRVISAAHRALPRI